MLLLTIMAYCVCACLGFFFFNTYFSGCKHFLISVDGLATATTLVGDPKPAATATHSGLLQARSLRFVLLGRIYVEKEANQRTADTLVLFKITSEMVLTTKATSRNPNKRSKIRWMFFSGGFDVNRCQLPGIHCLSH